MTVLQGAFWISDQKHRKYLSAGPGGVVWGVAPAPRGLDLLNSTAPRTQIWLIEKATDGRNVLFRNYETGTALDIRDQGSDEGAQIVVTSGDSESQIWEMNWLEGCTLGAAYQIKNTLTSTALVQTNDNPVVSRQSHGGLAQAWLIEPVLLPTLYWLTNVAVPALALRVADRPNARDNASRGVALVPKDLLARNQLWAFEYTATSECVIRSASHSQFVLDLSAQDSQTLLARKHHGGPNQCWTVKDEDEEKHIVSLANMGTNTLLATRTQQLIGGAIYGLAMVIEGNTHWQIHPSPQAPLFWVTIQSTYKGAFLAQAGDGSIVPSTGTLHANDHTVQWRFIAVGEDRRYVIVNRATGFMLKSRPRHAVVAEDDHRNDVNNHWALKAIGDTNVGIVNVGTKCSLYPGSEISIKSSAPRVGDDRYQWVITPFYDTLPSFALVNSHTGRCITNNPDPDVGTVITTDDINNFRSQWLFYHPAEHNESIPGYALLNKMSGNVLEHYKSTRIEAHDIDHSDNYHKWSLLPLRERHFALSNAANGQYLYDPGENSSSTDGTPLEDIRVLSWQLVSHRESGFDFISLDFDILQRMLAYIPSQPAELRPVVMSRVSTNKKKKGDDKSAYISHLTRITQVSNDRARVVLARLIAQWEVDSIPETAQPHTVASTDREKAERRWGIPLCERSLRRRSDEPGWIRIDLQGVYNVGGSWLANILGQWLEDPVFQIIIPVGIEVGRAIIQRAMLQSLTEGLTIEVRTTPPAHTQATGRPGRPRAMHRPRSLGAEDGKMNSLSLALGSIMISSLKNDELWP